MMLLKHGLSLLALALICCGCAVPVPICAGAGGVGAGCGIWWWTLPHCLTNCDVVLGQTFDDQHLVLTVTRPFTFDEETRVVLLGVRFLSFDRVAAQSFIVQTTAGKRVHWTLDETPSRRTMQRGALPAYVYLPDGTFLNEEIIRQGHGVVEQEPLQYAERLRTAEQEARTNERGIWATRTVRRSTLSAGPNGVACDVHAAFRAVQFEGGEAVELLGVRPPTTGAALGEAACAFLHQLTDGKQVRLDIDPVFNSRYAETPAYVYLTDGTFVNAEMLRQGYAHLNPDDMQHTLARAPELLAAEHEAREQQRGLWSENPIVGLEQHQSCPLGFERDGHPRCHVLKFKGDETVGLAGVRVADWLDYEGTKSRPFIAALTQNKLVRQEFDPAIPNAYDCNLAYIRLADGTFVNLEVVRQGYGRADVAAESLPLRYAEELQAAEREAAEHRRGLWSAYVFAKGGVGNEYVSLTLQSGATTTLTGVRIPNLGTAHERETWARISPLLTDQSVALESDPALQDLGAHAGSYVRLPGGIFLNREIIRQGFGYADDMRGRRYRYLDEFQSAEHDAREHHRGIWAAREVLAVSVRAGRVGLLLKGDDDSDNGTPLGVLLLGVRGGNAKETGALVFDLTKGARVHLEFDPAAVVPELLTAVYAYLPDGTQLNREIIRLGYGRIEEHDLQSSVRYAEDFKSAEHEARQYQRALWSTPGAF